MTGRGRGRGRDPASVGRNRGMRGRGRGTATQRSSAGGCDVGGAMRDQVFGLSATSSLTRQHSGSKRRNKETECFC